MNMKTGLLCLYSAFFALSTEAADFRFSVAAGYTHTLFTKTDGSLWTTGRNNYGQLGDGTTTDRNASAKIVDANVTAVAAGQYHSSISRAMEACGRSVVTITGNWGRNHQRAAFSVRLRMPTPLRWPGPTPCI